jgi:hypothetical protein
MGNVRTAIHVGIDADGNPLFEFIENKKKRNVDLFFMKRKKVDISWMRNLAVSDFMVYEMLLNEMDLENMVATTPLFKQRVLDAVKIFPNGYYKSIKKLHEQNIVCKINHIDLMVNPAYHFKGRFAEQHKVIAKYGEFRELLNEKTKVNGSAEFE